MRLADVPSGLTPDRFIADVVARGQTILLVGIRPGNLPELILGHRQVVFWPSNSRAVAKGAIPPNTGAVLFAKWISHTDHRRIRAMADKAGAYCPQALLGTGEMRVLLTALVPAPGDLVAREVDRLIHDAPEPATPAHADPPPGTCVDCGIGAGNVWAGSTREFVEAHWQLADDRSNGWQMREAQRLHRLGGQHGLSTSVHYLQSLVSQLNASRGTQERDEAQLTRERAEMAQAALQAAQEADVAAHAPDVLVPPARAVADAMLPPIEVVVPPAPTAATVKADEQRIGANLTELVRMLDDAAAVLQLARETVVDLAQQNARLQQSRDHLRARVNKLFDEGA